MGKIRIPVPGTIGKSVLVDPDASNKISALETRIAALERLLSGGGSSTQHRNLAGLQVGDDHPQYAQHASTETISGQWNFSTIMTIQGDTLREYIEDRVNAMILPSLSVSWTYNDPAGTLTAEVNFANPTGTIGLAAVNGSASTAMRSDATPALSQAIVPAWTGHHKWNDNVEVRIGTGVDLTIKHDGTNTSLVNVTGTLTLSNVGAALLLVGQSLKMTVNGTDRFEIDSTGALLASGSAGTNGQVLTSAGPGAPFSWTTPSSGSGGGGLWSYVGTFTAVGAATNITVTGLDISADECYYVQMCLTGGAAGTATLNMFFNGDTTATNYERDLVSSASSATGDNSAFGGLTNGEPGFWSGFIRRDPVTGRVFFNHSGGRINGTVALNYNGIVIWDTSANLTSFTVNSSVASQIASGSEVRVWKLKTTSNTSTDWARNYDHFEDFTSDVTIGGVPWSATTAGSGATVTDNVAATGNHPGVHNLETGTTTTGSAVMLYGASATAARANGLVADSDDAVFEALFQVNAVPDGTNTYTLRLGFADELSGPPTNGVMVEMYSNAGTAKWRIAAWAAGVNTNSSDSSASPASATWYHAKLTFKTGTAVLYINGVSVCTLGTGLPTAGFKYGVAIVKSAGTTNRTCTLDFVWVHKTFSTPRY